MFALFVHDDFTQERCFDDLLKLLAVLDFVVEIVEQEDDEVSTESTNTDASNKEKDDYSNVGCIVLIIIFTLIGLTIFKVLS